MTTIRRDQSTIAQFDLETRSLVPQRSPILAPSFLTVDEGCKVVVEEEERKYTFFSNRLGTFLAREYAYCAIHSSESLMPREEAPKSIFRFQ